MQKRSSPKINPSNPRHAAFSTLSLLAESTLHADELIDRELSRGSLCGPDRGLYSQLVFGLLRCQGTVDHYLEQLLNKPLERLEEPLRQMLRLGLYQLHFLDRIPAHAAVHEAVELAKLVLPRASGFVNGVLRNYLRKKESLTLPDRTRDSIGHLAAAHSVPRWLLEQWQEQLPKEELEPLAAASSQEPPLTIRANTLRITRGELMELFSAAGISGELCRYSPEGIRLNGHPSVTGLPGFNEGFFVVQDEASQLISHLLAPLPGQRVLDACAAPGGKTLHLAQLMENRGSILATDLTERKLLLVRESAERLGITIVKTAVADASSPDYLKGMQFDRILLDAPCSGLGVIRRNPEAKWRLQQSDFDRFAARQRRLLARVSTLLAAGGSMVYATCSTSPQEDEAVLMDFLSHNQQFVVEKGLPAPEWISALQTTEGILRLWPHRHNTDGFFAARITRLAP